MAIKVGEENIIFPEIHCRFLGTSPEDGKFTCTVYEQRFEKAPWCHTAEDAIKDGHLAQDCLYASDVPGYRGKLWATESMRARLVPLLRKKLLEDGLPFAASPDSALRLLTSGGEAWSYALEDGKYVFRLS